jgi:hypothetical protein
MFDLNPLANPDALWQHLLMIIVTVILGYIVGYISGNEIIPDLEDELRELEIQSEMLKRNS